MHGIVEIQAGTGSDVTKSPFQHAGCLYVWDTATGQPTQQTSARDAEQLDIEAQRALDIDKVRLGEPESIVPFSPVWPEPVGGTEPFPSWEVLSFRVPVLPSSGWEVKMGPSLKGRLSESEIGRAHV